MKKKSLLSEINPLMALIGVTIVVFLLQKLLGNGFTQAFLLNSSKVWSQPWLFITHMFLHADATHIFFNMYALFLFGGFLQQVIGGKELLKVYFTTGILAGLVANFFYPFALGASGAVMGITGALIILMPNLRLLLFLFIPTPLWLAGILFALMDIFGAFHPTGTGNIAHLVGLFAGILFGLYYKKKGKKFQKKFFNLSNMSQKDLDEYYKYGRI